MAVRGTIALLMLAYVFVVAHAAESPEEEPRFFLTSTGSNNLTFDTDGIFYVVLLGIGIFVAIALFGAFAESKEEPTGYAAPSPYTAHTAPYGHAESSYSVHRSLEEATNKYQ